MGQIILKNIRIHTNHGCLTEEELIGSDYRVDLKVKLNLERSIASDELADTINYVHLNRIVKEEMAIRSKLLEHVAGRISNRIFNELTDAKEVIIKISKLNPPIGGDVEGVSIKIKRKRFC